MLEHAELVVDVVTARDRAGAGRLRLGLSPTARYGIAPELLAACAASAPAVMIYTTEDTTGALLRDVARGQLDMAITFCAPPAAAGVEQMLVREEPAVAHLPAGHPLASRPQLTLPELADEMILIAASRDSVGFTDRILSAFTEAWHRAADASRSLPDLGLQAVREGLGLVIYARSAFPERLAGSMFVRLDPPLPLPFQLVVREGPKSAAVEAVVSIARGLGETVST